MTKTTLVSQEGDPAELRSLNRRDWSVLAITMVFCLADGYAPFVLMKTGSSSLHPLLPASTRCLPMVGAVLTRALAADLGGFKYTAAVFAPICPIGIVADVRLPEARGRHLPA